MDTNRECNQASADAARDQCAYSPTCSTVIRHQLQQMHCGCQPCRQLCRLGRLICCRGRPPSRMHGLIDKVQLWAQRCAADLA